MFRQRIATSIDYNRGLHPPIRWLHVAIAAATPAADALFGWSLHPRARSWAPLLLFTAAAVLILLPQDLAITRAAVDLLESTGGDIRRDLEAIQQYGQGLSMLCLAVAIWVLDPARRARLLDWAAGALVVLLVVGALHCLLGRPRPFDDPYRLVGPLGEYAVVTETGVRLQSVWSFGYELASMPSRHAALAVLASLVLSSLYPRLRGLLFTLAILVCIGRVATGAHYPTDTIVGAAVGLLVGRLAVGHQWGQRLRGWISSRPPGRTAR